jgi:serine/threonine protein kinase
VDVFSLGIILYRLAFNGKSPFFESERKYNSINQYFKEMKYKKLVFPLNSSRSQELLDLIEKMLIINKDKRIGWK